MRNSSFLFLAYAVIVFTLPCAKAHADTVTLKNGKKVEGKIIENANDYIKLEIIEGTAVTYFKDDIAQIDKESVQEEKRIEPAIPTPPQPYSSAQQPSQGAAQRPGQGLPARPGQGKPAQGSLSQMPPSPFKIWDVTAGEALDTVSGDGQSYSMVPPAGWLKNKNIQSQPPMQALVSYAKFKDSPMPGINVMKEDFPPDKPVTLEVYLNVLKMRLSGQSQSAKVSAPENVAVNGIPMHKINITMPQKSQVEIYCIVADTYVLSFMYRNLDASFAEDYNVFKQFMSSLNRKNKAE